MTKKYKRTRSSSVRVDGPLPMEALAVRTSPSPVVEGGSLAVDVLLDAPGSPSPRLPSPGLVTPKVVVRDNGSVLVDSDVGSEGSSKVSEGDSGSDDDDSACSLKDTDFAPRGSPSRRLSPAKAPLATGKADLPKPNTGSWKSLFVENRRLNADTLLSYVSDCSNSHPCVLLEEDAYNEVWKRCLIGYVAGKYPGFVALNSIITSIWKCDATLSIHESGWIVYKFKNEDDKLEVLNKGPYLIYGRPLILKSMPEFFDFSRSEMSSVPVWIKLPCLPLKCWTSKCLSKIASQIGKPIQCDKLTANMERISYARVLVEVNLMEDLPSSIQIVLPNGSLLVQPVFFESLPLFCRKCSLIGHSTDNCGKQSSRTHHGRGMVSKNVPNSAAGTSITVPSPSAAGVSGLNQPSSAVHHSSCVPISIRAGGSSSLQESMAGLIPAAMDVAQLDSRDAATATSDDGWLKVVGKSKVPALERIPLPAPNTVEQVMQEMPEQNGMALNVPVRSRPSEDLGLNLEKTKATEDPNALNPIEDIINNKGKEVCVSAGESQELNPVEVAVINKDNAANDPPESSSDLGEKKKWKKQKKGAKRGTVPRALS